MHHISFETTRQLIEQHHRELLQEAELRRIVRRLRRPAPEPARALRPEPPRSPAVAPVRWASRPAGDVGQGWQPETTEPARLPKRPAA